MKKLLCFSVLCGMSLALIANEDVPVDASATKRDLQVDFYRRIVPIDGNLIAMPLLAGLSIFCYRFGLKDWYRYYQAKYPSYQEEIDGENGTTLMLIGAGLFLLPAWYGYTVLRNYKFRAVPLVSLRSDGLWYDQKFVCKWEEIGELERYTYTYNGSVTIKELRIYSKRRIQLVGIDLLVLKASEDELIRKINEFIFSK